MLCVSFMRRCVHGVLVQFHHNGGLTGISEIQPTAEEFTGTLTQLCLSAEHKNKNIENVFFIWFYNSTSLANEIILKVS